MVPGDIRVFRSSDAGERNDSRKYDQSITKQWSIAFYRASSAVGIDKGTELAIALEARYLSIEIQLSEEDFLVLNLNKSLEIISFT